MRRLTVLVVLLAALLLSGRAEAQDFIRYYPSPSQSTEGFFTGPVVALGADLAPVIGAGTGYTCGAGWDCSVAGTLNKNADGVGTVVPNPAIAPTPGTTYRVTIRISALTVASGATYTFGGVTGTALSAVGVYTDIITAATSGNLIITPAVTTTRFTITTVDVVAITYGSNTSGYFLPDQVRYHGTLVIGTGGLNLANTPEGAEPEPFPHENGMYDTFVGFGAGDANTVGTFNSFLGSLAGNSNTNGDQNTFVGGWAGRYNTTGYHNTFVGVGSGQANTTAAYNTFVGTDSGLQNTEGFGNVFIGASAGSGNTTGDRNVFIGQSAGIVNGTGNDNFGLGNAALFRLVNSGNNVAIGSATLSYSVSGTYNIAIGSDAMSTQNASGTGNVSIGAFAGYATGAGANYNVNIGELAGAAISSGDGNVLVGYYAGRQSGASPADANQVTTGSNTTFIGTQAGYGSATQRVNVTAIGYQAYVDADNTVVLGDENVTSVLASSDGGATVTAGAFKVGANTGISGTVVVKGSDGNNCNLVFEGGIVTSETCP